MSDALRDFDELFALIPLRHTADESQHVLDARDRVRAALEQGGEALRRMIGIPASVGVCEPVEGFVKRPQDAVDCMGGMAAEITRLRAALDQPSTAEAQARALEEAADNLLNQADRMENSVVSQRATRDAAWFLAAEAKRIREESK